MDDQEYGYLMKRILDLAKIDLGAYKSQQMRRRLEGFIDRSGSSTVAEYCRTIDGDQKMMRELLDFLYINVSEFFRDDQPFRYLENSLLPELLRQTPRLNIWSAACSCGQEPYSIAMILERLSPGARHRILATDIDVGALEQARNGGPYPRSEVKNVNERLLKQYFVETEDGYRVADKIRGRVEFRQHNLLRDRFERGFDLIVCRNVVIYFSDEVKGKLYQEFHRSLKANSVLFTGGTEVMLRASDEGFRSMAPSFYRRVAADATALSSAV